MGNRFLISLRLEIEQPDGIGGLAIVRLQLQRLLEAQDRFVRALLSLQHLAHPEPDLRLIGIDGHRVVKALDRFVEPLLLPQDLTHPDPDIGLGGIEQ